MDQDLMYARQQVQKKKGFYQHLISYSLVNGFLLAINLITTPQYYWFIFPALSWGLGLAFHYIHTFGIPGHKILSKEWEEEEIAKELNQLQQNKNRTNGIDHIYEDKFDLQQPRKVYKDTDFV